MPNNANPAWQGGARQKVSFWSNGSADNKDLISETQACSRLQPEPAGVRRDRAGGAMLERATPNVVQRGDALTLLRSLPDSCQR
jgi:hypothetical protein